MIIIDHKNIIEDINIISEEMADFFEVKIKNMPNESNLRSIKKLIKCFLLMISDRPLP
jgi:hypothetical protein